MRPAATTDTPAAAPTALEALRAELALPDLPGAHAPAWTVRPDRDGFVWILDGERGVALVGSERATLELRCHGPAAACPPAELPRHYHNPSYVGCRVDFLWHLGGAGCGERVERELTVELEAGAPVVRGREVYADGTVSTAVVTVLYDPAWDAYAAEVRAELQARRGGRALEYCNIIPADIGDSRPEKERYPWTIWQGPAGLRKMLKNPLWFDSVGAQDITGEKHIAQGGFLLFGPDETLNPAIEILHSDPETGAATCDALQDEHIMAWPAEGRHARASGWFRSAAHWRLLSVPPALARAAASRAAPMTPGPMLAWKFQYPPLAELPRDLTGVELPGSPHYGTSDWSRPVPWDRPYDGVLWTPSPLPEAAIHYDREVGRTAPGSIRLRVADEKRSFRPGSGHTLHLEAGVSYRLAAWIRTEGRVRAWVEGLDLLFNPGSGERHASPAVGPESDWTEVAVEFTGRGEEAPFGERLLVAEGTGRAWFTELSFLPLEPPA
jgi:hypothetical protein